MKAQSPSTSTTAAIVDGFAGAVGNTPLIRLRRASEATGCDILGKAEFMNPGGSVKDRAALGIIRDAEQRGALRPGEAGHGGGGHRRQHRHRPDPGGERARLPLDHRGAGDAEPGEARLPAHDRRRPAAGAGQALPRPGALRAHLAPDRRRDGGRGRAGDLGQPVRQPGQRHRARGDDRAGDLGADRRAGRRLHLLLRHRGHARRRRAVPEGAEARRPDRAGRPDGQRPLFLGQDRRGEGRGQLDHRGHRPGHHRAGQPGGGARRDRRRGAGGRTRRRWSRSSSCRRRRGSRSAARPASM